MTTERKSLAELTNNILANMEIFTKDCVKTSNKAGMKRCRQALKDIRKVVVDFNAQSQPKAITE